MKKENVLLIDGDGTQTLPIAESLKRNGYYVHMFFNKKLSYGYPTKYVNKKERVSLSELGDDLFLNFLISYIIDHKIDTLLPLSDASASFLSKYKTELLKHTKYIIPDYDVFDLGYSKGRLMEVCRLNKIPHPRTINNININSIDSIDKSIFPAFLKPNYTTGGRGMSYIKNVDELKRILPETIKNYGECHLQEFISSGGEQYKVQLYMNDKSELLFSSVLHKQRYYPVKAGSSSCNTSIINDSFVEMCTNVLRLIKWVGFADFDLIEDPKDKTVKIMEINPRIPASIKTVDKSGINYGVIIADDALKKELKAYTYKPGKQLRHIGFELLWLLSTKKFLNSNPNWFNFFGSNIYFQDFSLRDPLPFIYGSIGNIIKQLNPKNRKSSFAK
jgi:D-aspartate ligase